MEAVAIGDPEKVAEEAVDVLFVMIHIVRHFGGMGAFDKATERKLLKIHERLKANI
jgi:NTP pyrophosphatase (non-canonical NTP hydrolase)